MNWKGCGNCHGLIWSNSWHLPGGGTKKNYVKHQVGGLRVKIWTWTQSRIATCSFHYVQVLMYPLPYCVLQFLNHSEVAGLVTGCVNWGGASNRVSSEITAPQCAEETCKISTRPNTIINIASLFCNKIFIYIS